MLTKLLKYEFKATGRIFLPMYVLLLVMAGANRLSWQISNWNSVWNNLIAVLLLTGYIFIFGGVFVGTFIVIAYRFYKNMYTDEGYLMFTLPVPVSRLLLSKLIAGFCWTVLSIVAACVSVFIMMIGYVQFSEFFQELGVFWNSFVEAMNSYAPHSWFLVGEVVVLAIIAIAGGILRIYAAFSIGQLTNKHRVLLSVGAYLGFGIVEQFLSTAGLMTIPYLNYEIIFDNLDSLMIADVIFIVLILYQAVITAAYYVVSWILMKKRVNLQ